MNPLDAAMSQHLLILQPTDVLFFRDGRPMEGSSHGHGAAWPMPHILDAALHHALRRANWENITPHAHTPKRRGVALRAEATREFGSLQTCGPFPIDEDGKWFFPRPADAMLPRSPATTHRPWSPCDPGKRSSLPVDLIPVVSTLPPSKAQPEKWLSAAAYKSYLGGGESPGAEQFAEDHRIFGAEHQIGIGMDPETGTQDGERFYAASYLRLREGWTLGMMARCLDKGQERTGEARHDLIAATFPNSGHATRIIAGGQQRTCTVQRKTVPTLPLPVGPMITGELVRWTLLTPALWPALEANPAKHVPTHPGGWLPTWIDPTSRKVQLKDPGASRRRPGEGREAWRRRVTALPSIDAHLVAAVLGRAVPVTGWALSQSDAKTGAITQTGGAKSTHLAVPAGSVYYFQATNREEARKLAAALNWHGETDGTEIRNRRSTLMGEKGFGLGVCSGWQFHDGTLPIRP